MKTLLGDSPQRRTATPVTTPTHPNNLTRPWVRHAPRSSKGDPAGRRGVHTYHRIEHWNFARDLLFPIIYCTRYLVQLAVMYVWQYIHYFGRERFPTRLKTSFKNDVIGSSIANKISYIRHFINLLTIIGGALCHPPSLISNTCIYGIYYRWYDIA